MSNVVPDVRNASRWGRLIRNGLSPKSLIDHRFFGRSTIVFRGAPISTDDAQAAWANAIEVLGGEYDVRGFVPGPGDRVVDIGANIGLFTMLAASRGAVVSSYEPHPGVFAHLKANSARWRAILHNAAVVGTPTDSVRLYVHPHRSTRNTLTGLEIGSQEPLAESIDVPAIALADVLRSPCDLMKIDCEGAEFDILRSEPSVLRQAARIIGEIHTAVGDADALLAHLSSAGFLVGIRRPSTAAATPTQQPFVVFGARRV